MKKTNQIIVLMLSAMLITSGCSKEDEPAPVVTTPTTGTGGGVTVNSPAQFTGTIDGVNYSYVAGNLDVVNGVGSGINGPGNSLFSSFLYYNVSGATIIDIEKGTLNHSGQNPTATEFKNFFTVNSYNFSQNAVSGFDITWFDANGDIWGTSFGTGVQTNSTISIDEIKEETILGVYFITAKLSFSCTLYDFNGNSKQLTNGVFVGIFENS